MHCANCTAAFFETEEPLVLLNQPYFIPDKEKKRVNVRERESESRLTSAWWSWFWCRTSMTNSARRMTCSSFLAGVARLATFSGAEWWGEEGQLILQWLINLFILWICDVMSTTMQFEEAKVINTWACRNDNTVDDTHNTSRKDA